MARTLAAVVVVAMLALAGCGGGGSGDGNGPPNSEGKASPGQHEPDKGAKVNLPGTAARKKADKYALQLAGTRLGCTTVKKGEGGNEPGCIYAAAYSGCFEGITGDSIGSVPYTQEFPEPELQQTYERAVSECGNG